MKISDINLHVVGVTFDNEDGTSRQQILETVKKEDILKLQREPSNIYDINAIKVMTEDNRQIGYIGKQYAEILSPMMDMGKGFSVVVEDTGLHRPKNAKKSVRYCAVVINEVDSPNTEGPSTNTQGWW